MKHLSLLFLMLAGCASPLADVTVSSVDFGVLSAPDTYVDEVRVTNVGAKTATLQRLERLEGPDTVLVITPTVTLEPGASTTWKVKFAAQTVGLTTARFLAVFDTGTSSFLVRGRLVEACAPIELDLGDARVGRTVSRAVDLTNPLPERASVSLGRLVAPFSAELAGTVQLAPRETRTITVSFTPASEGEVEAPWLVSTRTDCSASPSMVRGRALAAPLTLAPGRLHFGDVPTGTTVSATVELRNTSRQTVRVTAAQLSDSSFTFDTSLPVEIAAGGSAVFSLSARPGDATARSGELTLTTDAQGELPLSLPLLVNAARSCVTSSVARLDFGSGEAGCRSAGQGVTLVNQCPHPVKLTSTELSPGFSFTAGTAPGLVIGAGASAAMQVAFTPVAAGSARGALSVGIDVLDGSELVSVQLDGNATPAVVLDEVTTLERPRFDVLIVLDDGPQMIAASTSVAVGLGELVTLSGDQSDLRFAVMTTSTDAASLGQLRTMNGTEWLDNPTALQLQQFGALTGTQTARSSCLETLRAAFADPASGARRMRRPGSMLQLICITNRTDEFQGTALSAINDLRSSLPPLVGVSVVAQFGASPSCGGEVDDGLLRQWAQALGGRDLDVCGSWAFLAVPQWHSFGWRTNFFLSRRPDFSRGPLKVFLNRVELGEGEGWTWYAEGNLVSMEPLYVPKPGDELRLRYYPECTF